MLTSCLLPCLTPDRLCLVCTALQWKARSPCSDLLPRRVMRAPLLPTGVWSPWHSRPACRSPTALHSHVNRAGGRRPGRPGSCCTRRMGAALARPSRAAPQPVHPAELPGQGAEGHGSMHQRSTHLSMAHMYKPKPAQDEAWLAEELQPVCQPGAMVPYPSPEQSAGAVCSKGLTENQRSAVPPKLPPERRGADVAGVSSTSLGRSPAHTCQGPLQPPRALD